MKPDPRGWNRLSEAGAARLSPGFAERVLEAARPGPAPSVWSQFVLGAATAALCFFAVILFQAEFSGADTDAALADWQQIVAAGDDSGLAGSQ